MNNYIFPFLWMRGEPEEVIREEIGKIAACGIRAVCVEARPHKDFCGPGWWHDMDIVLDEARRRDMKIWILDDKHFPTGYANGLIEQHPERKKAIYCLYDCRYLWSQPAFDTECAEDAQTYDRLLGDRQPRRLRGAGQEYTGFRRGASL